MTDRHQKRSSVINLARLRKHHTVKPIAVSVAAVMLGACSDPKEEAIVFTGLNDCLEQMPGQEEKCEVAYQQALQEAARTAPKYDSARDCEYDFGADRCVVQRDNGSSWFMPLMAGYIIRDLMSPSFYPQPLFTSYSRHSPYRYRWITAGGYDYGDFRYRNLRVNKKYSPPPTVNRTIKRGGFGSSVRAKSSWGSSRKGWGG
jgi:uncharacterized protein YgiB involved in biofilm formation